MKESQFEIVRRPNGRFAWRFVVRKDGRPRVLARSARDYRTRARAVEAIDTMREADVVDAGGADPEPFPLPVTRFRIVSGVVPLIVDEFPTEYESQVQAAARQARLEAPRQAAAVEAAEPKRAPKRSKAKPRRARKAT
jgi:uncharacterized protein YegP (UPF0339 family)